MEGVGIFFGAILLAAVIGGYFKMNLGVCGIALSFLIGRFYLGMDTSEIIAQFPTNMFFVLFITTFFYGYAGENGALEGVSQVIIGQFGGGGRLMPWILFLAVLAVSSMGTGAMATPIMLSPVAFSLCRRYGFHPILASAAVWCGTMIGDSMPWGSSFQSNVSRYSLFFDESVVRSALSMRVLWSFVLYMILFGILWLVLPADHASTEQDSSKLLKPDVHFNRGQRLTLCVTGGVIVLGMLPGAVQLVFPNAVTAWLKSNLTIQMLVALGAVLLGVFHTADAGTVLKNRVPWNMIITISGLTMLMSFSSQMGVLETMAAWMQGSLPSWSILPLMIVLVGTLTYFLDGRAIAALMIPLLPALVEAAGCSPQEMLMAYVFAGAVPSLSPLSTGGAMALSGCSEESMRQKCMKMQLILPWPMLAILAMIGGAGIFGLFV